MSSTVYTYTKTLKNVTLLMSAIQNICGKRVENYDYNIATSELSISFLNVLEDDEKLALDTLVNIYVDSTILNTDDVTSFKNIRTYKSADQSISPTLNAVTEILFQSTTHLDRQYYQMAASSKYIFIPKPGTYLLIGKVGACLTSGGVAGTNTVLQWAFSYDDTRAEIAYINIINANVYTVHTNVNNMTDSTLVAAVFTVTATNGTNVRLSAKRTLGTTPLVADADLTSLQIMSIPGASFYEGNITANVTLTTTAANLNYGSNRILQYPFTHTVGQPNVTVSQSGYVMILAKATFNKTAGTDVSIGTIIARLNGTNIQSLNAYSHALNALNNKTSVHCMGIIPVVAGDIISLQAQTVTGTSLQLPSAESGLILMYLHPKVIPALTMGSFYMNAASGLVSAIPINISSTLFTTNVGGITPVADASVIPISGLYLTTANLTFVNPSNSVRECGVYISVSADGGKTYYAQPSVLSIKQIAANNKTTVTTSALLNLTANSRVKIQAASNGTTADGITVGIDGSYVNLINFNDLSLEYLNDGIFGTHFGMIAAADDLLVNAATYIEKCRIVQHNLSAGIYRISTNTAFLTTAQTTLNLQLIDIHSSTGNSYIVYTKTIEYPIGTHTFTSVDYFNALEGAHVLLLQISSPTTVPYIIRNTLLESWRAL